MPGVVHRLLPPELAEVGADHLPPAEDDHAVGIGAHLGGALPLLAVHTVVVPIEGYQGGGADADLPLHEAVKGHPYGDQLGALLLRVHLPDAPGAVLGVRLALRPGETLGEEKLVQLREILEAAPQGEEAGTHQPHLVLHLPLLPPRRGGAGHRLKQVVRRQRQESGVEGPLLPQQHLRHHRLHIVVDAPPAHPPTEGKRLGVGIHHHLQALPHIGHADRQATVAEPKMGDADLRGPPPEQQRLLSPIELESLSRRKLQGDEDLPTPPVLRLPGLHLPTHAVVSPLVAAPLQLLKQPKGVPTLPLRPLPLLPQQLLQIRQEGPQLGLRLRPALVLRRHLLTAHILAHGVAGEPVPLRHPAHRLPISLRSQPDLQDGFHGKHLPSLLPSRLGSFPRTEAARGVGQFSTPITPLGGSLLHAD